MRVASLPKPVLSVLAALLLTVTAVAGVVLLRPHAAGASATAGSRILAAARAELGKPYCFAGGDANGPTHGRGGSGCAKKTVGFDCSGLALYAYAQAGIRLSYHYTDNEYHDILTMGGRVVTQAQAAPGSLIFFHTKGDKPAYFHHVAIYSGNGMMIEAAGYHIPLRERPIWSDDKVVFAQPPQLDYWHGDDWFAHHGDGQRRLSNTLTGRTTTSYDDGWWGTTPLTGDWDGNGSDTDAFWDRSTGTFYASNAQYGAYPVARFGLASDIPVVGRWLRRAGSDTFGIYRPSTGQWFLQLHGISGGFTLKDTWGMQNRYEPIVGDWDGDGVTTLGLRRMSDGKMYLTSSISGHAASTFFLGRHGDLVVAGDWDGNGTDTFAIYRPSTHHFSLRNTLTGTPLPSISYGSGADYPFVGDWNGDGTTTLGMIIPS